MISISHVMVLVLTYSRKALNNPGHLSTVPVIQTVTNLISSATNPIQLTKMGEMYHPWF